MVTVRAAAVIYSPWVQGCVSRWPKKCATPGFSATVLDEMIKILGLDLEFIVVDSYAEAYSMMENGTADLLCNPNYPDINLMEKLDYTIPVAQDEPVFMIKDQDSKNLESHLIFAICHWSVWVLFAGILCAIISIKWSVVPNCTNRFIQQTNALNIVLTSIFLTMGILLGIYSNFLAIGLSTPPRKELSFRNLDELGSKLLSKSCRIVNERTRAESPRAQLYNPTHTENIEKTVRDKMLRAYKRNPPLIVHGTEEMVKAVQENQCYIGVSWKSEAPLLQDFHCGIRFVTVPEATKVEFLMYLRKNWTYGPLLKTLQMTGSMDELFLRLIADEGKRSLHPGCIRLVSNPDKPMTLWQLSDLFLFWISCGIVGGIIMTGENLHKFFRQRKNSEPVLLKA